MDVILKINKNITTLENNLTHQNNFALASVHEVIGKVVLALELGLITYKDFSNYIDILFNLYESLEPLE